MVNYCFLCVDQLSHKGAITQTHCFFQSYCRCLPKAHSTLSDKPHGVSLSLQAD